MATCKKDFRRKVIENVEDIARQFLKQIENVNVIFKGMLTPSD